MLELAALYRDRLGDRDQAAVYLHAVLEIEPENQMALGAYAEHFREKGDWAALADLLEFSFERARLAGISVDELLPRLEEIATVSEKQLGDAERAIVAWQRAEEIAPTFSRGARVAAAPAAEEQELGPPGCPAGTRGRRAADPAARAEICGGLRRFYREKLARPARAIEIYKDILKADPTDAVSMRAVVETYEREGDFVSLASCCASRSTRRDEAGARRPAAPRAGDLRRAHRRPRAGQWAANEILQAVPGDPRHADPPGADPRSADKPASWWRCWISTPSTPRTRREAADPPPHRRHHARPAAGSAGRRAALEEVVRMDPDDGKALARWSRSTRPEPLEDLRASWTCRSSASSPIRRKQAEYLRQLAGWSKAAPRSRPGAPLWEQLLDCCRTTRGAGFAGSHLQQPGRLDQRWFQIMERQMPLAEEPGRAGRHRPAARADLRREAGRQRQARWR
jgi:tetratricopeptide (TPR) repeat protein